MWASSACAVLYAPLVPFRCSFVLSDRRYAMTLGPCRLHLAGLTTRAMLGVGMAINGCAECLKKQRAIDRLTEELQRLQQQLRYQESQAQEGFFGAAPPSAQRPVKPNTKPLQPAKPKGARPGHPGAGRHAFDVSQADRVETMAAEVDDHCPTCASPLEDKGHDDRLVVASCPEKAERIIYGLPKQSCPRCQRTFQPQAPALSCPSVSMATN